jgi:hypothetical protein
MELASMRSVHLLAVTALAATALPAQQVRTLSKPDAEFEEPFTQVSGVRELRDGRVVVNDLRDKVVQLVDFKSGTAKKIGREGSGPREYSLPMALVALPGDTSGVYDPLNQRMLLILPNGEPGDFVKTTPAPSASTRGGTGFSISLSPPRYTDAKGRLYYLGGAIPRPDAPRSEVDSQPILRFARGAANADTVAWIRVPGNNVRVTGSGNRQQVMAGMANPFAPRDEWAVTADGRVAVIRSPEYRVDWHGPSSSKGAPIAYEKVKLTEKHKAQWREARRGASMITMRVGPGGSQASAGSGSGANLSVPEPTDWPDVLPPFTNNSAFAAPNGQIWMARTREASDDIPKYDVIDASGKVVSRVALPPRTRVAGFGNGVVYTVRTDEDDLQYLQRFRIQ